MHIINIIDSDFILSFITANIYVSDTPKNIYLGGTLLDEFTST